MNEEKKPQFHASAPATTQQRLFWIHGGCFKQGGSKYDERLSWMLTSRNVQVIRVDFDMSSPAQALEQLDLLFSQVASLTPNVPLWIGGVSSGAWFAWQLARKHQVAGLILLCPVLEPHARWLRFVQEGSPGQQKKANLQLEFFGTEQEMKIHSDWSLAQVSCPLLIFHGNSDADASFDHSLLLQTPYKARITVISMEGGHELCTKFPNSVADNIQYFLQE